MDRTSFAASARIDARPEALYAIVADYRDGHPRILPRPPFVSLTVEQGGTGAGTVFRCEMRVLGRTQAFRAEVTEPEPGRVLVETTDTGYVTTFTIDADADGPGSTVTIGTEIARRPGVLAALERWFTPRMLRPVYDRELENLAAVAGAAGGGLATGG